MTSVLNALACIARLEGEGYGTVYEYLVKRRYLDTRLSSSTPKHVCILGLPEKYGLSGDLLYYFSDKARLAVVDERKHRVKAFNALVNKLIDKGLISKKPEVRLVKRLSDTKLKNLDLIISSEVLQRLSRDEQNGYLRRTASSGKTIIFIPNPRNRMHARFSRLSAIDLDSLQKASSNSFTMTYLDAPPFPPGISTKRGEGELNPLLLRILRHTASAERFYPGIVLRRLSHITALESVLPLHKRG